MSDWKEMFESAEGYKLRLQFYECERSFTLEELYQAFKARLAEENRDTSEVAATVSERT